MKALVGAFNQEKAFSVIVKTDCETDGSFHSTTDNTSGIPPRPGPVPRHYQRIHLKSPLWPLEGRTLNFKSTVAPHLPPLKPTDRGVNIEMLHAGKGHGDR